MARIPAHNPARDTGERLAILETIVPGMDKRLEKIEKASESQDAKLDQIIATLAEGKAERAEMKIQIQRMTPSFMLVANARKWVKTTSIIGGIIGSILGMIIAAKGWIILNWNWFLGR